MPESYEIRIRKDSLKFAASHMTVFPDGTKESLHGHNYVPSLTVRVRDASFEERRGVEDFAGAVLGNSRPRLVVSDWYFEKSDVVVAAVEHARRALPVFNQACCERERVGPRASFHQRVQTVGCQVGGPVAIELLRTPAGREGPRLGAHDRRLVAQKARRRRIQR